MGNRKKARKSRRRQKIAASTKELAPTDLGEMLASVIDVEALPEEKEEVKEEVKQIIKTVEPVELPVEELPPEQIEEPEPKKNLLLGVVEGLVCVKIRRRKQSDLCTLQCVQVTQDRMQGNIFLQNVPKKLAEVSASYTGYGATVEGKNFINFTAKTAEPKRFYTENLHKTTTWDPGVMQAKLQAFGLLEEYEKDETLLPELCELMGVVLVSYLSKPFRFVIKTPYENEKE